MRSIKMRLDERKVIHEPETKVLIVDLGCKGRSNDEGSELLHISQGKKQLRNSSDRCVNLLRSISIEQRGKNKESRYKKHKQEQPMINE